MKLIWLGLITAVFTLILAACSSTTTESDPAAESVDILASGTIEPEPTSEPVQLELPNLGQAPEWDNDVWINTDEPLTVASQRGKVVLLEFWTFG
ncbi:MAG: hypothetical protein AAF614_30890 [Chloroflexota bacterium]